MNERKKEARKEGKQSALRFSEWLKLSRLALRSLPRAFAQPVGRNVLWSTHRGVQTSVVECCWQQLHGPQDMSTCCVTANRTLEHMVLLRAVLAKQQLYEKHCRYQQLQNIMKEDVKDTFWNSSWN